MHKKDNRMVAEVGGLPVIGGFLIGILLYLASLVFLYNDLQNIIYVAAIIISLLTATIIGLVDDMIGWKIGLRIRYKILLTFFIALPIMVINVGDSTMTIPFIGAVDFGLLYTLLIVPVAIMGASNGFNMIAGYNGLEAGMGVIILLAMGYLSILSGTSYLGVIALIMIASLLAFLLFNKYPAKVFPGDILTYTIGALIAIVAIIANIEKFALILFIPYFLELFLKARGKMKKESFAHVNPDGSLSRQYKKYYGLEHIAVDIIRKTKGKCSENNVVYLLLFFEASIAILDILYFIL